MKSKKQFYDYIRLYEYIIPKIVEQEDPQTFYWPSSPSSGGNFENSNAESAHAGPPEPPEMLHPIADCLGL